MSTQILQCPLEFAWLFNINCVLYISPFLDKTVDVLIERWPLILPQTYVIYNTRGGMFNLYTAHAQRLTENRSPRRTLVGCPAALLVCCCMVKQQGETGDQALWQCGVTSGMNLYLTSSSWYRALGFLPPMSPCCCTHLLTDEAMRLFSCSKRGREGIPFGI